MDAQDNTTERLRVTLRQRPGAHSAYFEADGTLTVEWYDFGDHAPYEFANMIHFNPDTQARLANLMSPPASVDQASLLGAIQSHFDSYFQFKEFACANSLPFTSEVDFNP